MNRTIAAHSGMPRQWSASRGRSVTSSEEWRAGTRQVDSRWKFSAGGEMVAMQERLADTVNTIGRDLTRQQQDIGAKTVPITTVARHSANGAWDHVKAKDKEVEDRQI